MKARFWTLTAVAAVMASAMFVSGAEAGSCTNKAAEGTGGDEKTAKFQVYEALLQATDWAAWAAWMSNGTTPGYKVGPVAYRCSKGGVGITCRGQAKICKL